MPLWHALDQEEEARGILVLMMLEECCISGNSIHHALYMLCFALWPSLFLVISDGLTMSSVPVVGENCYDCKVIFLNPSHGK